MPRRHAATKPQPTPAAPSAGTLASATGPDATNASANAEAPARVIVDRRIPVLAEVDTQAGEVVAVCVADD